MVFPGIRPPQCQRVAVAQTAVAASLAYFLTNVVFGQPFFAPIDAVICFSVTLGRRNRRAAKLVFGVAVGLMVADLLVLIIGNGTLQIAVVLLAMAAAVFFGGGALLVNQAAVSAILVVVLQPPEADFSPDRFVDALIGGGVALVINYLFPVNPERLVERAPVFEELVAVLEEISTVLESGDAERAGPGTLQGDRPQGKDPGRGARSGPRDGQRDPRRAPRARGQHPRRTGQIRRR